MGSPKPATPAISAATTQLVRDKLASSGLDEDDARTLGFYGVDNSAFLDNTFQARPGLVLPYFDPRHPGRPLACKPAWPGFFRVRYLGKKKPSFEDQTDKKEQRYDQPKETGVVAYFAPSQNWALLDEPSETLCITEGELKAAKACREGLPTIGLGGVWSWRSANLGVPFLPELEAISWVKRRVNLIFDSDASTNPHVMGALTALADALAMRGALPYFVCLPQEGEEKIGLDDFLLTNSIKELEELCQDAISLSLSEPLWGLNNEVLYVRDPGIVVVRKTAQQMAPGAFKDHAYSNRMMSIRVPNDKGNFTLKTVNPAATWLKWPLRAEAPAMVYDPSERPLADSPSGWNLWPGWGKEPVKGDVTPFKTLLEHLFKGANPQDLKWFVRWLAYPLQHPGTKLFTAVVMQGVAQGTGKSLVAYSLADIYGRNFTEIKQDDLNAQFNEWAERKQFALADDVTGGMSRKAADFLKKTITQKNIRINTKHVKSYTIPDCINYYFSTNQPDAFFLEDSDRRYFIHEVLVDPLPEQFYTDYLDWLNNKGGAEAIFDWLLRVDLGDFNPAAPARKTAAKSIMMEDGRSELASWVRRMLESPDEYIKLGDIQLKGDLFTSRELLAMFDPDRSTKLSTNGMGRELRRAGVRLANKGGPCRGVDGRLDRYYAVRDGMRWYAADAKAVIAHIKQSRGIEDKPKKRKF